MSASGERIWLSRCEVDLATGRVARGAELLQLTNRERELLAYLVAHEGRDVAREELLTEVWNYVSTVQTRAIDNMVRKVRAKIELDRNQPRHLLTVAGGYRFERSPTDGPDTRYPNRFFGRQELLAELEDRLTRPGGVTLVGPPGVGKTRLSWEAARRWRRGADGWFVALQDARGTDEVVTAVALALGLSATTTDALQAAIGRALAGYGPALLVLDNLEQLPDSLSDLVASWLAAAPQLRVLGTSRSTSSLPTSTSVAVPPLPVDVGSALFLERAQRFVAPFGPDPDIARLCEQLGGLPLCIELAAARIAVLPLGGILERMTRALELLRSPTSRTGNERVQGNGFRLAESLEAALRSSWDLLRDEERLALARAAVFAGGFDPSAGEHVLGGDGRSGLDLLHALVGWSLLESVRLGDEVRLRMLVGVHAFVVGKVPAEVLADARERHARWYGERVRVDPFGTLSADLENVRRALEHLVLTDPDAAVELAMRLEADARIPQSERIGWLRRILGAGPRDPARVVQVRGVLGMALAAMGAWSEGMAEVDRAVELAAALPDLQTWTQFARGRALLESGRFAEAVDLLQRIEPEAEGRTFHPMLLLLLVKGLIGLGRPEASERHFVRLDGMELPWNARANVLLAWSHQLVERGRIEAAEQRARQALALLPAGMGRGLRAAARQRLAMCCGLAGRTREALDLLEESRRDLVQLGAWGPLKQALITSGELELELGRVEPAIAVLQAAIGYRERPDLQSIAEYLLGAALALGGERDRGAALLRQVGRTSPDPAQRALAWSYLALSTPDPSEGRAAAEQAAEALASLPTDAPARAVVEVVRGQSPRADVSEVRLALALRGSRG